MSSNGLSGPFRTLEMESGADSIKIERAANEPDYRSTKY